MELQHSRGVFIHVLLFLVSFKGISEGLNLRIHSEYYSDEHDDTLSSFLFLEGQSYEAECWPEEYEVPEEDGLKNYSIQFLKYAIPYMPKPMWSEDPMFGEDSLLISGNEVLVPKVKEVVGDRYMVVRKEHTYESGLKVPKFVLSVKDVKPEDTGKLECYLMEDVFHPHHDPYDFERQSYAEYGPAVKVLGDITKIEMFTYEFSTDYNYDILPKTTMYNGDDLVVAMGDVPPVACRLFYPSFYPTVRFLIKDNQGRVVEDVTRLFNRYYDFQKQQLLNVGPIIKMEFMQDYINDHRDLEYPHFRVNATHNNKQLWCEAEVATPDGAQALKKHAHYITLRIDGLDKEDDQSPEGKHLPREDDKPSAAKGNQEDGTVQRDDTGESIGHHGNGDNDGTGKSGSEIDSPQRSTDSNGGSRSLAGSPSALWVMIGAILFYLPRL